MEIHGQRRTKYANRSQQGAADVRARAVVNNPYINAVSKLAYQIVGGANRFYQLPKADRLVVREKARYLHDLGADFVRASTAEATEKRGFVYVIVNPAWEDYCKIGRAFDPESRLRGYQTGTPFRDYELHGARYFSDAALAEREMHLRLAAYREEGEWFYMDPRSALVEIDKLQEQLYVG